MTTNVIAMPTPSAWLREPVAATNRPTTPATASKAPSPMPSEAAWRLPSAMPMPAIRCAAATTPNSANSGVRAVDHGDVATDRRRPSRGR